MKKLIGIVALAALGTLSACTSADRASTQNAEVKVASTCSKEAACAVAKVCSKAEKCCNTEKAMKASECSDKAKSECSDKAKSDCSDKAKSECTEKAGKAMNTTKTGCGVTKTTQN